MTAEFNGKLQAVYYQRHCSSVRPSFSPLLTPFCFTLLTTYLSTSLIAGGRAGGAGRGRAQHADDPQHLPLGGWVAKRQASQIQKPSWPLCYFGYSPAAFPSSYPLAVSPLLFFLLRCSSGGGGVNVTLGIPRLREIIQTARCVAPASCSIPPSCWLLTGTIDYRRHKRCHGVSLLPPSSLAFPHACSANIRTPAMTLPLSHAHCPGGPRDPAATAAATALARRLNPLPLSDLLDVHRADGGVAVTETLKPLGGGGGDAMEGADVSGHSGQQQQQWVREYAIRLHFSSLAAIAECFPGLLASSSSGETDESGNSSKVLQVLAGHVAKGFTPRILKLIADEARKAARAAAGGGGSASSSSAVSAAAAAAGVARAPPLLLLSSWARLTQAATHQRTQRRRKRRAVAAAR